METDELMARSLTPMDGEKRSRTLIDEYTLHLNINIKDKVNKI